MIVTQFTRGLAPARAIAQCAEITTSLGLDYWLVEGLSMVDAFNRCVEISDEAQDDVLILPDDIMAESYHYLAARNCDGIGYAPCKLRTGQPNTAYRSDGSTLYTGCVFLFLPRHVRERLEPTVFKTGEHIINRDTGELEYKRPSAAGKHADVHFWLTFNELDPRPSVTELPPVKHLIHDLSNSYTNFSKIREV